MALHLLKLCVGADSIRDLEDWIASRLKQAKAAGQPGEQFHTTRMVPKRLEELLDGGSLFWVIKGQVAARQTLRDVRPFTDPDGISRCHLVLEPVVIPVLPRPCRPFQGWRYLKFEEAPRDLGDDGGDILDMPEGLRRELRELGLLLGLPPSKVSGEHGAMINLLIALVVLFLITQAIRFAARAKPDVLVRTAKAALGVACFGVAGLLFLRGHAEIALGAAGVGLWLGGWASAPSWLQKLKSPGRRTLMRSAMVEIAFDPSSGAMHGTVLAGPFEGRELNEMSTQELQALHRICAVSDPEGLRHLEVYFDSRFPGWRGAGEGDANARGGSGRTRQSGAMTEDEAYEVLGLQKGAARDDITRAHRTLMKKLHPDQGGTTALAARVNEAKDILMRRHQ